MTVSIWDVSIPSLEVAVTVGFPDVGVAQLVRDAIGGHVSSARLPPYEWSTSTGAHEFHLDASQVGPNIELRFSGQISTGQYSVRADSLHWDFSKAFSALALPKAIANGLIPFHAACVSSSGGSTTLLPGASGSGKSSVAFAAKSLGGSVHASEMAFVRDGLLTAANQEMTIDAHVPQLFGLPRPKEVQELDGRIVVRLPSGGAKQTITNLVFPRVTRDPELRLRSITSRRARMLLYQNAVGELGVSMLLNHETNPVSIVPSSAQLAAIAAETHSLSDLNPVIAEGHPLSIAKLALDGAR